MNFSDLFILPDNQASKLYKFENSKIVEMSKLPFPVITKYVISNTGWIAGIKIKRRRRKKSFIYLSRVLPDEQIIKVPNIHIPEGYIVKTVNMKNDVLYVGGYNHNSSFYEVAHLIRLEDKAREWIPIEIPSKYKMHGKPIDDILIFKNKMILVDNMIFPKYLFDYDIRKEDKPELIKIIRLPNHGTYEHIRSGQMDENWIALFSSTFGINGHAFHINVLNADDYSDCGTVSSWVPVITKKKKKHTFSDYCLKNDKLILACGKKGLGIVKLSKKLTGKVSIYKNVKGIKKIEKIIPVGENIVVIGNGDVRGLQVI